MQRTILLTRFTVAPDLTIVDRRLVIVPIRRLFSRNTPSNTATFTRAANDRARNALVARDA